MPQNNFHVSKISSGIGLMPSDKKPSNKPLPGYDQALCQFEYFIGSLTCYTISYRTASPLWIVYINDVW